MTMFIDTATARARAESLMTSTCTVRAKSTGQTTDPDTGEVTDIPGAEHYAGMCRVRPAGTQGSTVQAGGAELFTFDYVVSLPFSATDVVEGDRVTIDSSPDQALAGRTIEVQHVARGDAISARRLQCSEVS